jgi:hypothetical protein
MTPSLFTRFAVAASYTPRDLLARPFRPSPQKRDAAAATSCVFYLCSSLMARIVQGFGAGIYENWR